MLPTHGVPRRQPRDRRVRERQVGLRFVGRTDRVSIVADGTEGNKASRNAMISADGSYVAYQSYASNLVPGDTNNDSDTFLVNRWTLKVTRLNLLSTGEQDPDGGTPGVQPSISADGRYVAFEAGEEKLVPGDYNNVWDVFVRDRGTATTTRASVADDGTETNHGSSTPSISADGRHVAFQSYATNLVPGSEEWHPNVYMRDLAG